MPPLRSRPAPDDSEGSSTREKQANSSNGKSRRAGNVGNNVGSSLQHMAVANTVATVGITTSQDNMEWSKLDPAILHEYRYAYGLNTPSAFSHPHNELVLSAGIGKMSPTMARRKDRRRQSKDQLTHAVRKHFNGLGIQENEVVVDFLYKVHHMDKNFRRRFSPYKPHWKCESKDTTFYNWVMVNQEEGMASERRVKWQDTTDLEGVGFLGGL